jgi:3-methyladenine DNA glycosylase/8-oxoguanine DNA glycosylase
MSRALGPLSFHMDIAGAGGEPVDLRRTFMSHGIASLPPMMVDESTWTFQATFALDGAAPRIVRITPAGRDGARVTVVGRRPGRKAEASVRAGVRHVLNLDQNLAPFYALAADDPDLGWVAAGAGRMIRGQTVFEDVVKTICTTNCSWAATTRMVGALVEHLGERAAGAPPSGPDGRTFPSAAAMAAAGENFYRDVARAGYRGRYMIELARAVEDGRLDLEALAGAGPDEISDEEMEDRLLSLPGVGPYAAAHVMLMLGRYSRLILDSWTRPTYVRLTGGRAKKDSTITRRFRRYGPYAGLAFWLFLTRDWIDE